MERGPYIKPFVWAVIVLGAAACLYSGGRLEVARLDALFLALTAVTLGVSTRLTISIPRSKARITLTDTFLFLALLHYGPAAAVLLATAAGAGESLRVNKKLLTTLFNAAGQGFSWFVTAWVTSALLGPPQALLQAGLSRLFFALALMALVHYVVNSWTFAIYGALKSNLSAWHAWTRYYLWSSITYFAGAAAAALFTVILDTFGPLGLLVTAPIVASLYFTYRMYLKNVEVSMLRAEQAAAHAQEVEGHLAELARHVAERDRAEQALKESEEKLRQAQKMEAVGRLAGGIAHDFNNLLTAITGYSVLVLDEMEPGDPLREDVEEIKRSADRAADLTRQILAFSRKQMLQPKVVDLNAVVTDLSKMLKRVIGEDVELVTALSPALGQIEADPGQLEQILMNLAVNARDAMEAGGRLTIGTADAELDEDACRPLDLGPGRYVCLSITDTGCGMDRQTVARIFEPFFTTKEVGKGTGLGLSTVHGIVKQSGGDITVHSAPGEGACFQIYFPAMATSEEAEIMMAEQQGGGLVASQTVLLVEDEPAVRRLAERVLRRDGYRVLVAEAPGAAFKISAGHGGPIDILVTDVVMPEMSGRELALRLAAERPEMGVLYTSGYTDDAIVHHGVLDPSLQFLPKPFTPEALMSKVREVLESTQDGNLRELSEVV